MSTFPCRSLSSDSHQRRRVWTPYSKRGGREGLCVRNADTMTATDFRADRELCSVVRAANNLPLPRTPFSIEATYHFPSGFCVFTCLQTTRAVPLRFDSQSTWACTTPPFGSCFKGCASPCQPGMKTSLSLDISKWTRPSLADEARAGEVENRHGTTKNRCSCLLSPKVRRLATSS